MADSDTAGAVGSCAARRFHRCRLTLHRLVMDRRRGSALASLTADGVLLSLAIDGKTRSKHGL